MAHEEDHSRKGSSNQYPLDPNCYKILEEIGRGMSAIVYKALCIPMDSTIVAIKAIDLEKTKRADFDNIRREAKTMMLLCHPNILKAHCSFTVESSLWVVTPFMSGGSLQSIIASSYPDGLSEPCIATVLKEILIALSYLHGQGHLHRDIKAGNILIDSNGSVKLADFGVSASIYEPNLSCGMAGSSSSSSRLFTDVTGTPYWMAPEVIHSHTGYGFKADIWSFGITALELAHGRPPLSHLPPSKSLMMKITKTFRFSDHYDKGKDSKNKKFSKGFKDMVALCLDHDPSKRPSAEKLSKHSFFKNNYKGPDFLVKNVLQGLPAVEQRLKGLKIHSLSSMSRSSDDDEDGEEIVKQRRISGWNFNEEGFQLEPVFPSDLKEEGDDIVTTAVRFGSEGVIQEGSNEGSNEEDSGGDGGGGGGDMAPVMGTLMFLKNSLDDQKQRVAQIIALVGGGGGGEGAVEMNREEQLMQVIEKLRVELENEKKMRRDVEMELEFIKLQLSNE